MNLRPALQRVQPTIAHCGRVGDEHQVELATLGDLRDLRLMAKIGASVDLRAGIQPHRHMVAGGMKEPAGMHLLAAPFLVHRSHLPHAPADLWRACKSEAWIVPWRTPCGRAKV